MNTKVIRENIDEAAALIAKGALVAVPTETVYGLAGNIPIIMWHTTFSRGRRIFPTITLPRISSASRPI